MSKISFQKQKITIQNIGKRRFYIGLIIGIICGITISLFFNYSRELIRFYLSLNSDPIIFDKNEQQFFNWFFAFISAILGHAMSIWIWIQNSSTQHYQRKPYQTLSATYIIMFFWTTIMVISRLGSIIPMVMYSGYENNLNFYQDLPVLFILLPIVLFINNWSFVRLVYRINSWFYLSIFGILGFSFILFSFTTKYIEKIDRFQSDNYATEIQYVDFETNRVSKEYNLIYTDSTIDQLKKIYSMSSINQIHQVKKAFKSDKPVSLDTIILQKIILHNFKHTYTTTSDFEMLSQWYYAEPIDIYRQILKHSPGSNEVKELIAILNDITTILNSPKFDIKIHHSLSRSEYRKRNYAHRPSADTIKIQHYEVMKMLVE